MSSKLLLRNVMDEPTNTPDLPLWWQAVLNRMEELVLVTDTQGRVEYVNRAFQLAFGYSLRDLLGKTPDAFVERPPDPDTMMEVVRRMREGDTVEFNLVVQSKLGQHVEASVSIAAFSDQGADISHYVCIARDLSRERLLQKQLHEVQRMEAMGLLAGGIANRFSHVLGGIAGQGELLCACGEVDAFTQERVKRIFENIAEGEALVSQIKAFVRRQNVHTSPVDLAGVLRQTLRFFEGVVNSKVTLSSQISQESCMVMGVSEELHQLVLNLLHNAFEALTPNGGAIEVSLKPVEKTLSRSVHSSLGQEVKCLRLRVRDNGHGVSTKDESRLFEPFFTNKNNRGAAGMGLTVVKATVERYRGEVTFYSAPDQGAVFEVFLPLHSSEAEADKDFLGPRGGGEHIVLVDDEVFITDAGSALLRELDYTVTTLNDPDKLAQMLSGGCDLLILDMSLPERSGLTRLKELQERGIDLPPVILSTSLEMMPEPWESADLPIERVLPKPCPARELTEAVRAVFEG